MSYGLIWQNIKLYFLFCGAALCAMDVVFAEYIVPSPVSPVCPSVKICARRHVLIRAQLPFMASSFPTNRVMSWLSSRFSCQSRANQSNQAAQKAVSGRIWIPGFAIRVV